MPGGDGRGAAYCVGYDIPGYMNIVPARMCRGRRRSFPFRRFVRPMQSEYLGYYALPVEDYTLSKEEEMNILENEINALQREHNLLKGEIEDLARRLNKLKSEKMETE